MLKRLFYRVVGKTGFQILRHDRAINIDNFYSLADSYEQLLNETIARKCQIPKNPMRARLLTQMDGTQPSEAFRLIMALTETATIDGDVCEFGVAKGQTSALIANEIVALKKTLHLFDSFEGLPKPTAKDELKDDIFALGSMDAYAGKMSVPMSMVLKQLHSVGFSEDRYKIHKGYFESLLVAKHDFPQRVSFAYVDFDLYEPIKLVLEFLDSVTRPGACIIVDDYDFFSTGARKAVDEFCAVKNVQSQRYALAIPNQRHGHFAILKKLS